MYTVGIQFSNYSVLFENDSQIELFKVIQIEYTKKISKDITLYDFAFYKHAIWQ